MTKRHDIQPSASVSVVEIDDRFDVTFKKIRKTLRVVCPLLMFCVACNCLIISVVVHLGIENYERLQESQTTQAEVAWMTKELRRISILAESAQTPRAEQKMSIPSPPPLQRQDNKTVRTDRHIQATTEMTVGRKSRDSLSSSLQERQEKCLARVEWLEYNHKILEENQDFLREQTFQRLLYVESALRQRGISSRTFAAFSASNPATDEMNREDRDFPIRFRDVTLNEGASYDVTNGKFQAPSEGLYLFHASLIASQSADCTLKLRKNSKILRQTSMTDNYGRSPDFNDDRMCNDALTMTQIIMLSRNDVIAVTSSVNCNLFPASVFQGYMIAP